MVCMLAAPRLCKVQNVVVVQGDSGGPLMCRDLAMRWVAGDSDGMYAGCTAPV